MGSYLCVVNMAGREPCDAYMYDSWYGVKGSRRNTMCSDIYVQLIETFRPTLSEILGVTACQDFLV